MRLLKKILFAFSIAIGLSNQAVAQMSNEQKIEEVYGTEFFANNTDLWDKFYILLQERIKYTYMPADANDKHLRLSDAPLSNKYNPNLVRDTVFEEENFNPLKYGLNFFAKTTQIYRIDGTDYLIVISPQQF